MVIPRARDETILVGDDVEVTIVDIRAARVRLGFRAPPAVPIYRKEVYEAMKAQSPRERSEEGRPVEAGPPDRSDATPGMLVLTREAHQMVVIGDDVEIAVLGIQGDKVRLGINAPPNVPIQRKELYVPVKREALRKRSEEGKAV